MLRTKEEKKAAGVAQAESKEGKGSMGGLKRISDKETAGIWLMRHGERMDECPKTIRKMRTGLPFKCPEGWTPDGSRWWDPPLTKRGKAQAKKEAERLKGLGFKKIYVSPMLRTLQTAEEVAKVLDLEVVIVPGLSSAAAYVQKMGIKNMLVGNRRNGNEPLLIPEKAQKVCPGMKVSGSEGGAETFVKCIKRMAKQNKGLDVLCVTHREAVWMLSSGWEGHIPRKKPPYCSVTGYSIAPAKNEIEIAFKTSTS